jgi:Zn-dependent metalloprotease
MAEFPARTRSINCILPPTVLAGLITKGSPRQREIALRTLLTDQSFRTARVGLSSERRVVRRMRRAQRLAAWRASWARITPEEVRRTVFDAQNRQQLPGRVVRREGDPDVDDQAVNEAYLYLGDTYRLYAEAYGRDSIDDSGMVLNGTVHYGFEYCNAFWDGEQMVFGDGDTDAGFNSFTSSIDVVGHELAHGVTEHEAGLIYFGQPGALNESLSDVFGSLVKQYALNQKAEDADWLIGAELLTADINGEALRSMKAPGTAYNDPVLGGKDPQPADMAHFNRTFEDNAGVHINSGIPNHAFYLAAVNLGGFAWEQAGLIWYETLCSPLLQRTARFQDFAALTVTIAGQVFPDDDEPQEAVRDGWAGVGIDV